MVFSSLEFLFFYFVISMGIYFTVPLKWRNAVLLAVSLVFYGWGEPFYVGIMLFSTVLDYTCGWLCNKYRGTSKQKIGLFLSVFINLGILFFFKYTDFFITTLNGLFGLDIGLLGLKLPIGISFYTFQTMSYTIDVYRGEAQCQKSIVSFGAYVSLFPQLIAGPIVRYKDIDEELRSRRHSVVMVSSGVKTFISGLAKKVLLANQAGALWESFRASGTVLGSWLALIFFAFQIYFDFSGYSDMAIGIGKILGFRFRENFYYPYTSVSITDFWRRWHISLGTWFREYVYIPLGGNRKGPARTLFNLLAVWFLTGLWHGASWNFVLWGLYYGIILILEKLFLGKFLGKLPRAVCRIYSLALILFGWWLFAFENPGEGTAFLGTMFGNGAFTTDIVTSDMLANAVLFVILCIASTPLPKKLYYKLYEKNVFFRICFTVVSVLALVVCTAYLVNSSYNPFLYFRF